ncbi:MAG: hypothetical protein IT169_11115 [Bryobacterales bacterium]|nr:hypothetical protein [Bryobacterales bacterium]
MDRRKFLRTSNAGLLGLYAGGIGLEAQELGRVEALVEEHFPSRLHQFVWRNWELANVERMALVVAGTPTEIREMGASMGLPAKRRLSEDQLKRIYITVIRQNWHLLPEEQIVELLGWTPARYRFTLKEDDFLDVKLGRVKPRCEPLRYHAPSPEEARRAAEIRGLLTQWFGKRLHEPGEERFAFVEEFERRPAAALRTAGLRRAAEEMEIGEGWSIGGDGEAASAAEHLRWFLEHRMRAKPGAGPGRVRLRIDGTSTGWRARIGTDGIELSAQDAPSLQRAVYELERQMERREAPFLRRGEQRGREVWSPRYCYSYFALYGDPLMEGDSAGLPEGYLERAAMAGMGGVWIQAVLNNLAPSAAFPEFGEGCQTRLANLRKLVTRAEKFGLKIYLYLNEPRAMPAAFFQSRAGIRGSKFQDLYSMCTSTEVVRDWLRASLSHVFGETPGLGGVFSITMSENHTNCFSHGGAWGEKDPVAPDCPRCSKRSGAETIAELITAFRDGVREKSKTAEIVSWDWGWGRPLAEELIPKLPKDTALMSISEWSQPVERGGVRTSVGEYSISVPGPGPRARRAWALGKRNGLRTLAKTQFNNTWEIAAVPWIPVLPLILEHCRGLAAAGVDGVMASWTCGGYPSPNLHAAASYGFEPRVNDEELMRGEAERIYGPGASEDAIAAWTAFGEAFREYPYGISVYVIPTQHGPANLLRMKPTGLAPGMILFPYDAYKSWRGAYPPDTVRSQFRALAAKWRVGLEKLEAAARRASAVKRASAQRELAIARTCLHHFESTANQVEFYLLRDGLPTRDANGRRESLRRMLAIAGDEKDLSRKQYFVARGESLVGYEASNHYFYTPLDLVEKMLNCEGIERQLRAELD